MMKKGRNRLINIAGLVASVVMIVNELSYKCEVKSLVVNIALFIWFAFIYYFFERNARINKQNGEH